MRPDFGSGLLALVFEPGGPELAADDAVPRAGRAAAVARPPDRGRVGRGRPQDEAPSRSTSLRRPAHAGARTVATSSSAPRRRRMRYVCCDERRLRGGQGGRRPQRHRVPRGLATPRRRPGAAAADALRPAAASRPAGLAAANVVIEGGERIRRSGSSGRRRRRRCRPARTPRSSTGLDEPDQRARGPDRPRGDFSRYTLRLVAGGGSDAPPAGFDPLLAAVDVLLQGRVPVRLRLRCRRAPARRSGRRRRRSTTSPRTTRASAG